MSIGDQYVHEIKRRIGELRSRAIDRDELQEAYLAAAFSVLSSFAPGCERLIGTCAEVIKLEMADSSILVDIHLGNGLRITGSMGIPLGPQGRDAVSQVEAAKEKRKQAKRICQDLAFHRDLLGTAHVANFHRYAIARKGNVSTLTPKDIALLAADFIESEREHKCPYEKEQ